MAEMGKPLRLKDLLELDCDSCSAAGFRCYPRRLGEPSSSPMSLGFCSSPSLRRERSKLFSISRSLSRRIRESFWWRRNDDDEAVDAAVRGCGCGSEAEMETSPSESSDSSGTTTRRSRSESDSEFSSASSSSALESMHTAVATADREDGRKKREEGSSSGSEADDKEQLSPVAVMDFPCFDDDAGLRSPASDDSHLSRVQRGRNKSHKIRRFGCLDELLVPVNLQARLASSPADTEDQRCVRDEPDAEGLLALLADAVLAGVDAVSERLLLDFFVEVKTERRSRQHVAARDGLLQRRKAERLGNVVAAARGWLLDGAGWGLHDVLRGGAAVTAEMETEMHVGEEEREVGTVVAGVLTEQLVDEVVKDLLVL